MEDILLRFPHVFGAIISNFDDKDLTNSRFVSKTWKNSIDNDRCLQQRIINKLVNANEDGHKKSGHHFDEEESKYWEETNAVVAAAKAKNWEPFLSKAPLEYLKEITKELLDKGFGKRGPNNQYTDMKWWVFTRFYRF